MIDLRIRIPDKLHRRLKNLVTHHGEQTHLIRCAIREYVEKEEERRKQNGEKTILHNTRVETSKDNQAVF